MVGVRGTLGSFGRGAGKPLTATRRPLKLPPPLRIPFLLCTECSSLVGRSLDRLKTHAHGHTALRHYLAVTSHVGTDETAPSFARRQELQTNPHRRRHRRVEVEHPHVRHAASGHHDALRPAPAGLHHQRHTHRLRRGRACPGPCQMSSPSPPPPGPWPRRRRRWPHPPRA